MTHLPTREALAEALMNEWLRSVGEVPLRLDALDRFHKERWLTKADECLAALAALSAPAAEPEKLPHDYVLVQRDTTLFACGEAFDAFQRILPDAPASEEA